jgi:two-component system alkaline phosphatase synthesis response regulator PhoP
MHESIASRRTKVLCIDDDPDVLECLQAFLESFGYTVRITTSGVRAIEIAAQWNADAVIVDYNMPDMNGHQVASEIKRVRSRVAIILLSGAVDIPEETLALVDAFIDKNLVASHLLPTISALVGRMPVPPQMSDTAEPDDYSYDEIWPIENSNEC